MERRSYASITGTRLSTNEEEVSDRGCFGVTVTEWSRRVMEVYASTIRYHADGSPLS